MKTTKYKIDPAKLTPEQRRELEQYEATEKQLQSLSDIADMMQELVHLTDESNKTDHIKALGAVLTDAREQLVKLNEKEAPEAPDYSKPIVEAIAKLQKSFKAPDVHVEAPNVTLEAPKVDLSEFNNLLKNEIPKAFEKAIKLIPKPEIPQTDNTELLQAWEGISEQLVSIETATRMKPQMPNTLKVINPDGSTVGGATVWGTNDQEDGTTSYFGQTTSDGTWRVLKVTDTSVSYATVTNNGSVTTYTDAWTNKATLTYGRYDQAF